MSSCQQPQTQGPMSQAPRDPWTTTSAMVATPLSTATQKEALNQKCFRCNLRSNVKKRESCYFKLEPQVKDIS